MNEKNEFSLFRQSLFKNNDINIKTLVDPLSVVNNFDNFHLLPTSNNDTIINLDNIQNIEESHSKLFPNNTLNQKDYYNYRDDSNIELINKKNFFNDSFFQQILSSKQSKESFEKINSNMNFHIKLNSDRTNSSQFFYYPILKELNTGKKPEEVKQKLISQINSLSPLQKENISLISNIYQVPDEIKSIKYYRKVKPNGDSFYLSFIYQYMKHFLLKGDISIISRIINLEREYNILNQEKDEKNNIEIELGNEYINKTISYNFQNLKNLGQAMVYLSIIYTLITNQKDKSDFAIKLFNNAFSYDKFFSKLLILFVKNQIKKFLKDNHDKINYDKYCIKNKLINSNYFFPVNKKFDYELYLRENLFIDQMEPTLFIISIIPYIFNITLNLYINEESQNEFNENDDELLTKMLINEGNTEMTINILYSSYSYHIIENKLNEDDLQINIKKQFDVCNIFNYTQHNAHINEYEKEYIEKLKKEKCKKCHKTEYIIIKNVCKNYPICLHCFRDMVDNILIKRYKNMLIEKFKFIEFYLKEIPLINIEDSNNYINLSSNEFFYLFNQNLFTYFRNLIKGICDLCGKFSKNKKIINKKCGCKCCIACAIDECDIIYFNNFEKNYINKTDLIKCNCGKDIEKNQYASQIYNMLSSDQKIFHEKKAKNRIKNYLSLYCMICGRKLGIGKSIKIINIENNEHKLCENCTNIINSKDKKIICVICNKEHILKDGLKMSNKFTNKGTEIIKEKSENNIFIDNINIKNNDDKRDQIDERKEKNNIVINNETEKNKNIEKKKEEYINKKTRKQVTKKINVKIDKEDENKINKVNNKESEKINEEKEIKENISDKINLKSGITGSINTFNNNNNNKIMNNNGEKIDKRNENRFHCCIIC